MKREEKNQQTKRRIMDRALAEFSQKGYGAGSINTVCSAQDISKGIIYHYFKSRDDLYLACVEECFSLLTQHIKNSLAGNKGSVEEQLKSYFSVRMAFFRGHPIYRPIFCEAVISPPVHLKNEISARKQAFDRLNIEILEKLLQSLTLRHGITMEDVVETFGQYQDFINAKYDISSMDTQEFELRDESCQKALNILLYGVIERREN